MKPWSKTSAPYFSLMKALNSGNSQDEILIISSLLTFPVTFEYWPSLLIAAAWALLAWVVPTDGSTFVA